MSEPVTAKLDYAELARIYKEAAKQQPRCKHTETSLTVDEHGVFCLRCSQCGLHGFASKVAAQRLGWIE